MATKQSMVLFSNPAVLAEKASDRDLLGFDREVKRVADKIRLKVSSGQSSLNAYVGAFGTGKSSILNEIREKSPSYEWVNFELWRYANRQEIWDGFVIRVASQLKSQSELSIADEIEGTRTPIVSREKIALILLLGTLGWLIVSLLMWQVFDGAGNADAFVRALLKYSFPELIALLTLGGIGSLFYKFGVLRLERPLRRIFELEDMLLSVLTKKLRKPLIVVAEDVDRTTDDGAVFLETLRSFLFEHSMEFEHPIVVLAPQSPDSFQPLNSQASASFQRSLKIYDDTFYSETVLEEKGISDFLDKAGIVKVHRDNLAYAVQIVAHAYKSIVSMRLVKNALREVQQFVEANEDADPAVAFAIVISRYIPVGINGGQDITPAQSILISSNSMESGKIGALYQALLASTPVRTSGINRRTVNLKPLEGQEVTQSVRTYPDGSEEMNIDIDVKYEQLVRSAS